MTTEYPGQLAILQAKQGNPVDLECMQSAILQHSLEELRALQAESNTQIQKLTQLIEHHTQVFSPAKAYSHDTYNHQGNVTCLYTFSGITNRFTASTLVSTDNDPFAQLPAASSQLTFQQVPPQLRFDPPAP